MIRIDPDKVLPLKDAAAVGRGLEAKREVERLVRSANPCEPVPQLRPQSRLYLGCDQPRFVEVL